MRVGERWISGYLGNWRMQAILGALLTLAAIKLISWRVPHPPSGISYTLTCMILWSLTICIVYRRFTLVLIVFTLMIVELMNVVRIRGGLTYIEGLKHAPYEILVLWLIGIAGGILIGRASRLREDERRSREVGTRRRED